MYARFHTYGVQIGFLSAADSIDIVAAHFQCFNM
jgi:hypothetical protein